METKADPYFNQLKKTLNEQKIEDALRTKKAMKRKADTTTQATTASALNYFPRPKKLSKTTIKSNFSRSQLNNTSNANMSMQDQNSSFPLKPLSSDLFSNRFMETKANPYLNQLKKTLDEQKIEDALQTKKAMKRKADTTTQVTTASALNYFPRPNELSRTTIKSNFSRSQLNEASNANMSMQDQNSFRSEKSQKFDNMDDENDVEVFFTFEKRRQMCKEVNKLSHGKLGEVVNIIKQSEQGNIVDTNQHSFEVDFETLRPSTLKKIQKCINKASNPIKKIRKPYSTLKLSGKSKEQVKKKIHEIEMRLKYISKKLKNRTKKSNKKDSDKNACDNASTHSDSV